MVDNLTVKPLVRKMVGEGLDPETVNKYVGYVKQVVKSKLAPNGEPLYPRVWNASVLDLPVVVYSKQKRPALKVEGVNALIANAESDEERYLYVLLAATGMRISEALALETRHFINGGRTIVVEQQVLKDRPCIKKKLKTDASYREIDLHPDIANYLNKYISGKSGLILRTKNGTPHLYGNLADDWLDQRLAKLGLYEAGMGWHSFKRFRNSWLRAPAQRCQEDLRKFWLAHKPKEMGELYSALKEDLPTRLAEAERVSYGFVLLKEVVPNVPRKGLFVVTRKTPATGILINRNGNDGRVAQLGEHLLCKHAFISPKSLNRRLVSVQNPLLVGLLIGLHKLKGPSLDKHSEKWARFESIPNKTRRPGRSKFRAVSFCAGLASKA
jgi:integrase